jgi:hypothetical protein
MVGVVGDDRDDLGAELTVAPAPEQVGEAVVFARDHDRHPLALARLGEAMLHLEAFRDLRFETPIDVVSPVRRDRVEHHPHEEATLVAGVLVGVDDVEAGIGGSATRRSARPVRTGEQQTRVMARRWVIIAV